MLRAFWTKHANAEAPLRLWYKTTEKATWNNFTEVRRSFSTADTAKVASKNTVVIFDIGGNKYRLIAAIHYNTGCVYALKVMTHAEYSRNKWMDQL
jgi:mRNA interferase HigB